MTLQSQLREQSFLFFLNVITIIAEGLVESKNILVKLF